MTIGERYPFEVAFLGDALGALVIVCAVCAVFLLLALFVHSRT